MKPLAILLLVVCHAFSQDRTPIPLPADPSAPVITLDYRGGGPMPPRPVQESIAAGPLTIRADGRGTVGNLSFSLSPAQLQELLHFVINEQRFFDFDPNVARADIVEEEKRRGVSMGVSDVSHTVIRVAIAGKAVESSFHAVALFSRNYPNARGLAQFAAIETRLHLLVNEIKKGNLPR